MSSTLNSLEEKVELNHVRSGNDDDPSMTIPVIDMELPESELVEQIVEACSTWGFFQVMNHGVSIEVMERFRIAMSNFFSLPKDVKLQLKRDERNARGYFDDELTKQRPDWKECLDVGVPGSRDWSIPDDEPENACLDGYNRFPKDHPSIRACITEYFQECSHLSHQLSILMALGLLKQEQGDESCHMKEQIQNFLNDLQSNHTSYLRLNYYPVMEEKEEVQPQTLPPILGISPHTDAGFVTVLLQDDTCHSLQVAVPSYYQKTKMDWKTAEWVTVKPIPGALTINTGDMAMIWSNGRYKAPLHRVLTSSITKRYSAPFFYNPGYNTHISPLQQPQPQPQKRQTYYHPCLWGYFRAVRFAGDLTDIGVEIQISDFESSNTNNDNDDESSLSSHISKQKEFLTKADFSVPFSVTKYRPLLQD